MIGALGGAGVFDRLLALRNDLGLLAEEYDTEARRQIGNFPQAFSHVALINTAFNLTRATHPAEQRARGDVSDVQAPRPPGPPKRPPGSNGRAHSEANAATVRRREPSAGAR